MKTFLLTFTALLISAAAYSQTVPEMIFRNPVLINGTAGQNGAKYRFSNVATGIDAIIEISGRSSSDVVLGCIDSTGIGWDKAFQPIIGIPNVGPNRDWWMQFRLQFVTAGTNNSKKLDKFFVTGLDIDGDNGNLREWVEMDKVKKVTLSPVNLLSDDLLSSVLDLLDDNNCGDDHKLTGPITNYANIDTLGTPVMASYEYAKKDRIDFKMGGKTNANGGSSGSAAMRMNSTWFKQFTMSTLPVKLVSFTASLNNNKADLKWTTASEINVSHFVIEKSTDGSNYTDAGVVLAYGNTTDKTNYNFSDNLSNTLSGVVYYRLRSVDMDGNDEYSDTRIIRTVKQADNSLVILTYPNPASNEIHITIPASWQNKKVVYELFKANGQADKKMENENSGQTETLNISSLAPGFYIVRVSCEGQSAQQTIIKD